MDSEDTNTSAAPSASTEWPVSNEGSGNTRTVSARRRQFKRSHHSKTTNGCLTCKKRHVKCDENKPECIRCTTSGRECEGYVARKVWIFESSREREARSILEAAADRLAVTIAAPLTTSELATDLERWNFQYFCEVTVPTVARWSFFTDGQDFWTGFGYQYARSIPAVQHLAVALASRHRDTASGTTENSLLASRQYGKSLSRLTRSGEAISVDTVLVCCILNIIYEYMDPDGAVHRAFSHQEAALRIFRDPATKWTPVTRAIISNTQRMEAGAFLFTAPVILPGAEGIATFSWHDSPILPEMFSNLTDIQRTFFEIFRWHYLRSVTYPSWDRHCPGFLQLLDLFSRWHTMLLEYVSGGNGDSGRRPLPVAQTMLVQFRMVYSALWYSVNDQRSKHQRSDHVHLVDLSSPDRFTVRVPVKSDPTQIGHRASTDSGGQVDRKQIGIWPALKTVHSPGASPYVALTIYADPSLQDGLQDEEESRAAHFDTGTS